MSKNIFLSEVLHFNTNVEFHPELSRTSSCSCKKKNTLKYNNKKARENHLLFDSLDIFLKYYETNKILNSSRWGHEIKKEEEEFRTHCS